MEEPDVTLATEDTSVPVEDEDAFMMALPEEPLFLGEEATPGEGRPAPLPGLRGPPHESITSRASSPSVLLLEEPSMTAW